MQDLYRELQFELTRLKQQSPTLDGGSSDDLSNQRRLEQYQQLLKRLDETNNNSKELARIQRLLASKGHRIDARPGGELNINLKNLEGQIQSEMERLERNIHVENDFHNLEKELDIYLKASSDQLQTAQQHQDKGTAYQVRCQSLAREESRAEFSLNLQSVADRLQQGEVELSKLIQLAERLKPDLPRAKYEQLQRTIQHRQEHLQALMKSCQQARGEHEQMVKTQNKLNDELIAIHDWFKRLVVDLTQPLDLNFSLNNVNDFRDSLGVSRS